MSFEPWTGQPRRRLELCRKRWSPPGEIEVETEIELESGSAANAPPQPTAAPPEGEPRLAAPFGVASELIS